MTEKGTGVSLDVRLFPSTGRVAEKALEIPVFSGRIPSIHTIQGFLWM